MTARAPLRRTAALVLLGGLFMTGCAQGGQTDPGPQPRTPSADPATLVDTRWQATELGGDPVVEGTAVTAVFGADSLAGSGGCNRYRTTFSTDGTTIEISEAVAATMMACDPPVMEQENAYLSALASARTFAVTAEELTLNDEAGQTLVVFAAQSQDLTGSWVVTGYHDGNTAVTSVVPGTTPALDFADGTVSGTGGCNRLTGTYEVQGTTITLGPIAATLMECAEPEGVMDQEAALITALESAATFTIEADRLVFRNGDDAMAVTLTRG